MAAHEIVAEATTLTGSIGVVLASLDIEELLESVSDTDFVANARQELAQVARHFGIARA